DDGERPRQVAQEVQEAERPICTGRGQGVVSGEAWCPAKHGRGAERHQMREKRVLRHPTFPEGQLHQRRCWSTDGPAFLSQAHQHGVERELSRVRNACF
ncbi:unnamed protein product, partial [Ectocarpus sp. 12 AP-2014]